MLPEYLQTFNEALLKFQEKYTRTDWSVKFRESLINDYSFFRQESKIHWMIFDDFELTEENIKKIHNSLMDNPLSWETEFKPELVGEYRNIPTVGSREHFFKNKE